MNMFSKRIPGLILAALSALPIAGCAAESSDSRTDDPGDPSENGIVAADGPDEDVGPEASSSDPGSLSTQAVTAPSCVTREMIFKRTLHLENDCKTQQWVKVIVNNRADSDCFAIGVSKLANVSWVWPGTFGGLVSC